VACIVLVTVPLTPPATVAATVKSSAPPAGIASTSIDAPRAAGQTAPPVAVQFRPLTTSAVPLVASPDMDRVGMARFTYESVTLMAEGGIASRIVKSFEVNISRNLDTDTGYVVGGGANLAIITAGKASVGGRVEALFTKEEGPVIVAKSRANETTDFKVVFCRPHEFMIWNHTAAKLGRAGVPVPSQRGLTASFNWQGFKDTYSTGSAVEYVLINTVNTY